MLNLGHKDAAHWPFAAHSPLDFLLLLSKSPEPLAGSAILLQEVNLHSLQLKESEQI
jgi:hypothetical protein